MPYVKVAEVDEIAAGQAALIERAGATVVVYNAGNGRFYATSPTCPHEDGPLAEGWLEGDAVICPWHGYDFELATGACRVAPGLKISVYPVRVNGTTVEIDLP
jgi:nitrite reductase/ring-hydroxylating ferredoxin subunit